MGNKFSRIPVEKRTKLQEKMLLSLQSMVLIEDKLGLDYLCFKEMIIIKNKSLKEYIRTDEFINLQGNAK